MYLDVSDKLVFRTMLHNNPHLSNCLNLINVLVVATNTIL